MDKILWACFLVLAAGQGSNTTRPSGDSNNCAKQPTSPCARAYPYAFISIGNFGYFSCGADGIYRCPYDQSTGTTNTLSCINLASPCGLEARPAPTYDFSTSADLRFAYFSCDIDYYRCQFSADGGTFNNCVKRTSPCPFSVASITTFGSSAYFACTQDGYYQCEYNADTGVVNLLACVQKRAPCPSIYNIAIVSPYVYFSCSTDGFYKCLFDPSNFDLSTCMQPLTPCGGVTSRTYSFSTAGPNSFFDCYNDGWYKCQYNAQPLWTTTGPCRVVANCVQSQNHPAEYTNNEQCFITPLTPQLIHFEAFSTEPVYDTFTINNVTYSGTNTPPDQNVSTAMRWASDFSVVNIGWKFCAVLPTTAPTPRPTAGVQVTAMPTNAPPSLSQTAQPTAAGVTPTPGTAPTAAVNATAAPTNTPRTAFPTTSSPTVLVPTVAPLKSDSAGVAISVIVILIVLVCLAVTGCVWWRRNQGSTVHVDREPPARELAQPPPKSRETPREEKRTEPEEAPKEEVAKEPEKKDSPKARDSPTAAGDSPKAKDAPADTAVEFV